MLNEGLDRLPPEVDARYSRLCAAVQWPGVRAGFAVLLGVCRMQFVAGRPVIELLDERQEDRLWELVRICAAWSQFYRPERFLADGEHVAAMQFVSEHPSLRMEHSLLCAMPGPFAYSFPLIRRALQQGWLVIPNTRQLGAELLTAPVMSDLAALRLVDYPAMAALSYAFLDASSGGPDDRPRPTHASHDAGRLHHVRPGR